MVTAVLADRSDITAAAGASQLAESPTWQKQQRCATLRFAINNVGHMGLLVLENRAWGEDRVKAEESGLRGWKMWVCGRA